MKSGCHDERTTSTTLLKNAMVIPVVGVELLSVRLVVLFRDGERPAGITGGLVAAALRRAVERADGRRTWAASLSTPT